jgi:para-aminobenzoate synthetase component 1
LISQPIKGTAKRFVDPVKDELAKTISRRPKERAENIMITDLVRNDLSQTKKRIGASS